MARKRTARRDRIVIVACRCPESLSRQIDAVARDARRSRSDWVRLTLEAAVKQRTANPA